MCFPWFIWFLQINLSFAKRRENSGHSGATRHARAQATSCNVDDLACKTPERRSLPRCGLCLQLPAEAGWTQRNVSKGFERGICWKAPQMCRSLINSGRIAVDSAVRSLHVVVRRLVSVYLVHLSHQPHLEWHYSNLSYDLTISVLVFN